MNETRLGKHPTCVPMTYQPLLLALALLSCCTARGPPVKVLAFAGGHVVLPCSFSVTPDDHFPNVEWSKEGLQPNVVFLYRDGCETHEMKNPVFLYRTSFIAEELKNGNISLRISDVRLSDAGTYQCMRLWKDSPRDFDTVELVVGASSEPKLSVISADSGVMTLHCKATCWQPLPEIQFVDDRGNNITAEEPRTHQEASGCYTVTRRVTLQDPTNRVSCRVHQLEINQTRSTEITVPVGCMRSCSTITGIAVGVIIVLLLLLFGFIVLFLKRSDGKSGREQKQPVTRQQSDQSTMSTDFDDGPLLQSVRVDGVHHVGNGNIEELRREVADLKSKLHEREETIRQLQTINNDKSLLSHDIRQLDQQTNVCTPASLTDSCPPDSASLAQHQARKPGTSSQKSKTKNPASGHPVQRNHHIQSSPATENQDDTGLSGSSSASTSNEKLDDIEHLTSQSALPAPKTVRFRRHTVVFTLPADSNNRFSVLEDLKEESEPLVPFKKSKKVKKRKHLTI